MRSTSGARIRVGLLVGLVGATLVALGPAAGATLGPAVVQSGVDPDAVVMRVAVQSDGDAVWTIDFRVRLDDGNTTAAFESVAAEIDRNASAYTRPFASGLRRTVRSAQNRTGREMALRNVTVVTGTETLPQRYGVVTYRFEWADFAAVEGDRIRAGDSLSGLFLDAESTLVVAWPDGYRATSVSPDPDERGNSSVTWHGPTDFGPDAPRIVAEPATGGGQAVPLAAIGAVAVLVLAVGAGWIVRSGVPTATGDVDATGEETDPPEELLSNEEKVLRLLDEEDGRIKQQRIAGEFDWTDAKTSQVVGNLRDQGSVETFRIGRENVVALPEESDL